MYIQTELLESLDGVERAVDIALYIGQLDLDVVLGFLETTRTI